MFDYQFFFFLTVYLFLVQAIVQPPLSQAIFTEIQAISHIKSSNNAGDVLKGKHTYSFLYLFYY